MEVESVVKNYRILLKVMNHDTILVLNTPFMLLLQAALEGE